MRGICQFVLDYWRGKLRLRTAFWMVYAVPAILLIAIEPLCFPPFIKGETAVSFAVWGYLLLTRGVIFSWQVVGLLRCSRDLAKSDRLLFSLVQASVLLGIGTILVATLGSIQALQTYKQELHRPPADEPAYSLRILPRQRLLQIQGPLDIGITGRVAELLDRNPQLSGVILNSQGGQVYEGRGLALQIRQRGLDTYSTTQCLSSCTTAFIGGKHRRLAPGARLGFHRYIAHVGFPVIDVAAEQQKDRQIFLQQGVNPEFINRIHQVPPQEMWWPEIEELKDAGVIADAGFQLDN